MHCTEIYMYCLYTVHIYILHVCVCVYNTGIRIQDKVLHLLTTRKYIILNGDSVLPLCDVFQEHKPSIQQNLPVCVYVYMHVCICMYV